jgi:photosystem II PsbY protein
MPADHRNDCQTLQTGNANGPIVRKITATFRALPMDLRLVLVAAPIVLAASWAVFHIGRAAVGQLQMFISRGRAA